MPKEFHLIICDKLQATYKYTYILNDQGMLITLWHCHLKCSYETMQQRKMLTTP